MKTKTMKLPFLCFSLLATSLLAQPLALEDGFDDHDYLNGLDPADVLWVRMSGDNAFGFSIITNSNFPGSSSVDQLRVFPAGNGNPIMGLLTNRVRLQDPGDQVRLEFDFHFTEPPVQSSSSGFRVGLFNSACKKLVGNGIQNPGNPKYGDDFGYAAFFGVSHNPEDPLNGLNIARQGIQGELNNNFPLGSIVVNPPLTGLTGTPGSIIGLPSYHVLFSLTFTNGGDVWVDFAITNLSNGTNVVLASALAEARKGQAVLEFDEIAVGTSQQFSVGYAVDNVKLYGIYLPPPPPPPTLSISQTPYDIEITWPVVAAANCPLQLQYADQLSPATWTYVSAFQITQVGTNYLFQNSQLFPSSDTRFFRLAQ